MSLSALAAGFFAGVYLSGAAAVAVWLWGTRDPWTEPGELGAAGLFVALVWPTLLVYALGEALR